MNEKTERNKRIVHMKDNFDLSLEDIGDLEGLSRQRVWQILKQEKNKTNRYSDLEPEEYRRIRKTIGPIHEVAGYLGVSADTIRNREAGRNRITYESELALRFVAQVINTLDESENDG